jgi:hypothetical protein
MLIVKDSKSAPSRLTDIKAGMAGTVLDAVLSHGQRHAIS